MTTLKTITPSGKVQKTKVDELWLDNVESIGYNGFDIAVYFGGGMSVWPCGKFSDEEEEKWCECATCKKVRATGLGELDRDLYSILVDWP